MRANTPTRRPVTASILTTLAVTAAALIAGCSGHGRVAGFEPRWEKLVVPVAEFPADQPSGVAVSRSGRLFVNFPYWNDRPDMAVAEIRSDGSIVPYPNHLWDDWDRRSGPTALTSFVCAQALYVDEHDHLWILDSGNPRHQSGVVTAGPKLFRIDLATDTIVQVYFFDSARELTRDSYLTDVRVDTAAGVAYMSDAGRGGLYVYDLATRRGRTVLLADDSTKAEPGVEPRVGAETWRTWWGRVPRLHVSSLALSPDRRWLYYHGPTTRRLHRVPTDKLRDPRVSDDALAAAVENLGGIDSTVDALWFNRSGDLYLAAIEKDAIYRRRPDGRFEPFVADQRLQWPDALALGPDGYLYITASMRHLRSPYRAGDQRDQPFYILKVSIPNVELAMRTRREAQEARLAAARAQREAAEAAQRAEAERARAQAERLAARAQAEIVERASAAALSAAERRTRSAQQVEHAADQQEQAADRAAEAADRARAEAERLKEAAQRAREAAAVARARAQEAQAQAETFAEAMDRAKASASRVESARVAWRQAREQAERAAERARAAEQRLAELQQRASLADNEAHEAEQAARREADRATQARLAAEQARRNAELAAARARDAELAELNARRQPAPRVETASVPVQD